MSPATEPTPIRQQRPVVERHPKSLVLRMKRRNRHGFDDVLPCPSPESKKWPVHKPPSCMARFMNNDRHTTKRVKMQMQNDRNGRNFDGLRDVACPSRCPNLRSNCREGQAADVRFLESRKVILRARFTVTRVGPSRQNAHHKITGDGDRAGGLLGIQMDDIMRLIVDK